MAIRSGIRIVTEWGYNRLVSYAEIIGLLDIFTADRRGLAPASGGGTAKFLRADGAFAVVPGVVFTQTADKTVGNTVVETTLFGTGVGSLTFAANTFTAGASLRVTLYGVHSVTGAETMRLRAFLTDTTHGAVVIGDTTAVTEINNTNESWELSFIVTCRSTGASGTVATSGIFYMHEGTTVMDGLDMQTTAGTTYVVSTDESITFDVRVTHGTAAAGNTITCMNATVEALF